MSDCAVLHHTPTYVDYHMCVECLVNMYQYIHVHVCVGTRSIFDKLITLNIISIGLIAPPPPPQSIFSKEKNHYD